MPRAVRFDEFGPVEVLQIVEVDPPRAGAGEVVVEVVSSSVNPGEISIREGLLEQMFPTSFPTGEGSDFAGRVLAVGDDVTEPAIGAEVIGWSDTRSAHAEQVVVPADQVVLKPAGVDWEQGGALFVAGTTAYACVKTVGASSGDTVLVAGAAGGVGSLVVQLATRAGATVLGVASEANHEWLRELGVTPVAYGDGLEARVGEAAPDGVDALIDCFGGGYLELGVSLGVDPARMNTIIDFENAPKLGAQAKGGSDYASAEVMAELAAMIAAGDLHIPIAKRFPLAQIADAYTELAERHTRGKIVIQM